MIFEEDKIIKLLMFLFKGWLLPICIKSYLKWQGENLDFYNSM